MKTLNISFKPERRKDKRTGLIIDTNVQLLAEISCIGRIKPYTGIRLNHIDDFDITKQKLITGKKAKFGTIDLSPALVSEHLKNFELKYYSAFKKLIDTNTFFTIKDIHNFVKPRRETADSSNKRINPAKIIADIGKRQLNTNTIGNDRYDSYIIVSNIINRFILIKKRDFLLDRLTIDDVIDLGDFIKNEYLYVQNNPEIYKEEKRVKKIPRKQNTVSTYLGILSSVLKELKYNNPMTDGTRSGRSLLSEKYNQPIYLTIEELLFCLGSDYPIELKLDRDSFLLQCALGLRVGDYYTVSLESEIVTSKSFPYISYVASKTSHDQTYLETIETPIVKYAMDIINEYGYMPFRDYDSTQIKRSYNVNIRKLLKHWNISRMISIRGNNGIEKKPLYELGSSKLARKTFVDIINKSQLNPYLAGVHKEGSDAVHRYTHLTLEDRYKLFSMAFRQPF